MRDVESRSLPLPKGTRFNYPSFPQYKAFNVTGHPPGTTTNDYYLLFPKGLPSPGATFQGELHVLFNHGRQGWWRTLQDCVIQ